MRIPEHILKIIKVIEQLSSDLQCAESILYSWLEQNGIDAESEYDSVRDISIDGSLEELMHGGSGENLIKALKKL